MAQGFTSLAFPQWHDPKPAHYVCCHFFPHTTALWALPIFRRPPLTALLPSLGSKREARSKRGEKEERSLKGTLPAATAVPRASSPPSLYGWAEGRQMDTETIFCTTWIHLGGYSLGTPWRERVIFAGIWLVLSRRFLVCRICFRTSWREKKMGEFAGMLHKGQCFLQSKGTGTRSIQLKYTLGTC